jgi:hypothetical protein
VTAIVGIRECSIPGCGLTALPTDHLCLRHYRMTRGKARRPWTPRPEAPWCECQQPEAVPGNGECRACKRLVLTAERIRELRGRRILSADHMAHLHKIRAHEASAW